MADAQARKDAIKKASAQVQSGGVFVRRAAAASIVLRPSATKAPVNKHR